MINEININKIEDWNFFHAIIMLISILVSYFSDIILISFLCGFFSFCFFLKSHFPVSKNLFGIGYANGITLFRVLLLCVAVLYNTQLISGSIFVLILMLDLTDGFVARKYNEANKIGEYFDMECDALFVALLCLILSQKTYSSGLILIPAVLRYIFKIIVTLLDKSFHETRRMYARYLAGGLFVLLLSGFFVSQNLSYYFISTGIAIVSFSFAISFFEFFSYLIKR